MVAPPITILIHRTVGHDDDNDRLTEYDCWEGRSGSWWYKGKEKEEDANAVVVSFAVVAALSDGDRVPCVVGVVGS